MLGIFACQQLHWRWLGSCTVVDAPSSHDYVLASCESDSYSDIPKCVGRLVKREFKAAHSPTMHIGWVALPAVHAII
jgi:hypothetical protein